MSWITWKMFLQRKIQHQPMYRAQLPLIMKFANPSKLERRPRKSWSSHGKKVVFPGASTFVVIFKWSKHGLLTSLYLKICSLIVAAPDMDVWSIMQKLHPLLSYSASFAIYHQYLQVSATKLLWGFKLYIEELSLAWYINFVFALFIIRWLCEVSVYAFYISPISGMFWRCVLMYNKLPLLVPPSLHFIPASVGSSSN